MAAVAGGVIAAVVVVSVVIMAVVGVRRRRRRAALDAISGVAAAAQGGGGLVALAGFSALATSDATATAAKKSDEASTAAAVAMRGGGKQRAGLWRLLTRGSTAGRVTARGGRRTGHATDILYQTFDSFGSSTMRALYDNSAGGSGAAQGVGLYDSRRHLQLWATQQAAAAAGLGVPGLTAAEAQRAAGLAPSGASSFSHLPLNTSTIAAEAGTEAEEQAAQQQPREVQMAAARAGVGATSGVRCGVGGGVSVLSVRQLQLTTGHTAGAAGPAAAAAAAGAAGGRRAPPPPPPPTSAPATVEGGSGHRRDRAPHCGPNSGPAGAGAGVGVGVGVGNDPTVNVLLDSYSSRSTCSGGDGGTGAGGGRGGRGGQDVPGPLVALMRRVWHSAGARAGGGMPAATDGGDRVLSLPLSGQVYGYPPVPHHHHQHHPHPAVSSPPLRPSSAAALQSGSGGLPCVSIQLCDGPAEQAAAGGGGGWRGRWVCAHTHTHTYIHT